MELSPKAFLPCSIRRQTPSRPSEVSTCSAKHTAIVAAEPIQTQRRAKSVGCTFVTSSDSCNGVRYAGTGTAAHIRSQTEGFGNFARRRAKEPWERVKPGTKVTWERVVCCFCCCMTVRIPEELGAFRLLRRRYMNSFHVYLLLGWASCLGGWVFAWWRDSWVLTRSMMSDDAGDDDESVSQFLH